MGTGLLYSFAGSFTIPKLYHNGKALPSSDCLQRNFSKTRVAYHWKYIQVILTAPPSAATLIESGKLPAYNICLLTSLCVLSFEVGNCSMLASMWIFEHSSHMVAQWRFCISHLHVLKTTSGSNDNTTPIQSSVDRDISMMLSLP